MSYIDLRAAGLMMVCLAAALVMAATPAGADGESTFTHKGQRAPAATQVFQVGEMATLTNSSITAGSTQTIRFEGEGGYSVAIETDNTEDGKAHLAVPMFVDTASGAVTQGVVLVSLNDNHEDIPITIAAPQTPGGVSPGEYLALGMEALISVNQTSVGYLSSADASRGSMDSVMDELNAQNARLADFAAQLRSGSVTMGEGSYQTTMGQDQIDLAGKLFYSMMWGVLEEGGYTARAQASTEEAWKEYWNQTLYDLADAHKANTNMLTMLTSGESLSQSVESWFGESGGILADMGQYGHLGKAIFELLNHWLETTSSMVCRNASGAVDRQEMEKIDAMITNLERLINMASLVVVGVDAEKASLLGLGSWYSAQQTAVAGLRAWHTGVVECGEDSTLTNYYWLIKFTYTVTHPPTGNSRDKDDVVKVYFKCDKYGGVLKHVGTDPDGTYSVSGNTITFTWHDSWGDAELPCCWNGDNVDTYTFTGIYNGGYGMSGTFTKELPGDCYRETKWDDCKGMITSPKTWTARTDGSLPDSKK